MRLNCGRVRLLRAAWIIGSAVAPHDLRNPECHLSNRNMPDISCNVRTRAFAPALLRRAA